MRNEDAVLEVPPPVLRIIPVSSLLPHEEHDVQRGQPLTQRIAKADIWLHPPIVTPLPDSMGLYVVLDGANRCHAVTELGFPHILVQVVEYNSGQVTLDTWNHVISQIDIAKLLEKLHALAHVEVHLSDILTAQALLAQREALAYIVNFSDSQEVYVLTSESHGMEARTKCLQAVVDCYKQRCVLDRINNANPTSIIQMFPEIDALVVFPHYEPSEILVAAREKILLPPGISRHVIQGRAMRLLYPIDRLRDPNTPLEVKNRELEAWRIERIQQRAVRFYAESIYLFDD